MEVRILPGTLRGEAGSLAVTGLEHSGSAAAGARLPKSEPKMSAQDGRGEPLGIPPVRDPRLGRPGVAGRVTSHAPLPPLDMPHIPDGDFEDGPGAEPGTFGERLDRFQVPKRGAGLRSAAAWDWSWLDGDMLTGFDRLFGWVWRYLTGPRGALLPWMLLALFLMFYSVNRGMSELNEQSPGQVVGGSNIDVVDLQRPLRINGGEPNPLDWWAHNCEVKWVNRGTRDEHLFIHFRAELQFHLSPREATRRAREIYGTLYELHQCIDSALGNSMVRIRIDLDPFEREWNWVTLDTERPSLTLPVAELISVKTGRGHNPSWSESAGPSALKR